jgi:hypothetical protein
MSTFQVGGALLSEDPVRLTGNTATVVYTAVGRAAIASIVCVPTSGTPNLTIEIYNAAGSSIMTLRKAVATTAGTAFIWNEVFTLNPSQTIRVTSSAAGGDMDVMVSRAAGVAAADLRA